MTDSTADRNLLFGILALQLDFIDRDRLVSALHAWVLEKHKPLGQILVEQRALAEPRRTLLEALVAEHLRQHDDDPEKSLAAINSVGSLQAELNELKDTDISASLGHLGTRYTGEPATTLVRPTPPTAFGEPRFRVLRPHAKGGLGQVSVARDEELRREVALKELQSRHADDPESRARFLLEAEITGGLEHPGIVPVYGLGQYADGRPYYAMRFIRGDSLREAIERFHRGSEQTESERAIAFRKLLGRFIDVCNAVQYAHSRGVLHRDLKPGNIMLGKYGETLVVDWGLAKPLGHSDGSTGDGEGTLCPVASGDSAPTQQGSAVGTPAYMSPEQAAGRHQDLGPASDVYSLGATLFHLLTGQPPFSREDVGEILRQVQAGDFSRPRVLRPDCPAALEAVCLKAMSLAGPNRYATPGALADEIEKWLADEPVTAYREPWTRRARRWVKRHRVGVTSAAAALVVAAVCLAASTLLLARSNRLLAKAIDGEREAKIEAEKKRAEADTQRDNAVRQEHVAIREREEAARQRDRAREAVDTYLTQVSEQRLLREPNMQPLRRELLASALVFYQRFVDEQADDPARQADLGDAYDRLAQITAETGNGSRAIELNEKALAIYERQVIGEPAQERKVARILMTLAALYQTERRDKEAEVALKRSQELWKGEHGAERAGALALATQGVMQHSLGRYPAAVKTFERAQAIQERLLAESQDPNDSAALAVTFNARAISLQQLGRHEEAEKQMRSVVDVWDDLCRRFPGSMLHENARGMALYTLAESLAQRNQTAEAEATLRKSIQTFEAYRENNREALIGRAGVSTGQHSLGVLCMNLLRFDEAEQQLVPALDERRKLAAENAANTSYQENVAATLSSLGQLYSQTARLDAAEGAHREAFEIRSRLARGFFAGPAQQSYRAWSLANLAGSQLALRKFNEAEKSFAECLAVQKKLAAAAPAEPMQTAAVADAHVALAGLYAATNRTDDVARELEAALEIRAKLAARFPENSLFVRPLVQVLAQQAGVERMRGNGAASERLLKDADEKLAPLLKANPQDAGARSSLAALRMLQAPFHSAAGRLPQAEAVYREAAEVLENLAAESPQLPHYRRELARCRFDTANVLAAQGNYAAADAEIAQGLEIRKQLADEFPQVLQMQTELILAYEALAVYHAALSRRDELIEAATQSVARCKKLVDEHPQSVDFRSALALAHVKLARHLHQLGQHAPAESHFLQALEISGPLVRESPQVANYGYVLSQAKKYLGALLALTERWEKAQTLLEEALAVEEQLVRDAAVIEGLRGELAFTHQQLGYLHASRNKLNEARRYFAASQAIWKELVAGQGSAVDFRPGYAAALGELGKFELAAGRLDAADVAIRESLAVHQRLYDERSIVPMYRRNLALAHRDLATAQLARGNASAATAEFERALDHLQPLHNAQPGVAFFSLDLARTHWAMAANLQLSSRLAESIEQFDKALAVLEAVVAKQPHLVEARQLLAQTYAGRGVSQSDLGRNEEARKDFNRALEYDVGPERDQIVVLRAVALAHLGEVPRAIEETESQLKKDNVSGQNCYNGGIMYAVAAARVQADSNVAAAERERLAKSYLDSAMLNLRRAIVLGYLRTPVLRKRLETHPDWAPVRGRPEYPELLRELAAQVSAEPLPATSAKAP
jgi:serine/threonine protein kinase/tetratricopeptide (TPR) repeat protein